MHGPCGAEIGRAGGDDIVRTGTWWQRASAGLELVADGSSKLTGTGSNGCNDDTITEGWKRM